MGIKSDQDFALGPHFYAICSNMDGKIVMLSEMPCKDKHHTTSRTCGIFI